MPDVFLYPSTDDKEVRLRDPTVSSGTVLAIQDSVLVIGSEYLVLAQSNLIYLFQGEPVAQDIRLWSSTDPIGGAAILVIQDATHVHAADSPILVEHVQGVTLVIADALHAHSADSLVVVQHHVLAVAEDVHAHAADNIALVQHHALAIAEALHAQSADGLTLTQHHVLAIQDAAHGLTSTVIKLGGAAPLPETPIEVTGEFSSISVRGSHINSMGWLAVAGERRARLRSIFRAHRLQREEDEIRRMQKRAKRRPIDRQTK